MGRLLEQLKTVYQRLLAIVIFLVLWEITVRAGLLEPTPVPPASRVIVALRDLAVDGDYLENTFASLQRILEGYVLASVIAIPLGFLIGWFQTVEKYLFPLLRVFRQTPLIAIFPIFILFFGLGEIPCVLILVLAATWSMLLCTISGVQNVDPSLIKAARSVGTSEWNLLKKVVFPATIPSIVTGMRCAYTEITLVLIPVEMLGVNSGWGIGVSGHEHHGQNHVLMYGILISMALVGVLIDYLLVTLERELCRWKVTIESIPKPEVI